MQFFRFFVPPHQWRVPVIILLGVFTGLFIFIFYISKASSYLSDKPEACTNCHIMAPQYATWSHSSHRTITNCNDCHVPHNNVFNKWYFKGKDGLRHATIFTLRREPQVIFVGNAGKGVVQENCERCHEYAIENISMEKKGIEGNEEIERRCWECHIEMPHGKSNSLSSVPYARVPLPQSPVPDWLKKMIKSKNK